MQHYVKKVVSDLRHVGGMVSRGMLKTYR